VRGDVRDFTLTPTLSLRRRGKSRTQARAAVSAQEFYLTAVAGGVEVPVEGGRVCDRTLTPALSPGGERAWPAAYINYAFCTAIRLGFDSGCFGMVTVSTPFLYAALTFSESTDVGSSMFRLNPP